jgi:hypothetical protein
MSLNSSQQAPVLGSSISRTASPRMADAGRLRWADPSGNPDFNPDLDSLCGDSASGNSVRGPLPWTDCPRSESASVAIIIAAISQNLIRILNCNFLNQLISVNASYY